jgi:hypothetical protein
MNRSRRADMNSITASTPGRISPKGVPLRRRSRKARRDLQAGLAAGRSGDDESERRLFLIALQARAFLEPAWLEWHASSGGDIPAPLSRSTCGRSSLFLKRVLQTLNPFPGVEPRATFGFHAGNEWKSHAWVEIGGHIIDLTADQFGDEPVIVTARPDPRYQKGVCDSDYPEFVRAHRRAVERLWARWQASSGRQVTGQVRSVRSGG